MNKEVTILMQLRDRVSSGFGKISNGFTASVRRMKDATAGAKKAVGEFIHEMQSGSEKSRAFAEGLKAIAVGAGIIAGAITLAGRSAIRAAIEMEALKRGLAAVAGGAQAAEAQMKDLQKVAKLPGLGLPEAIQGSTRLQAVGINAQLANKALMELGNALARVGKGREELSGVILALTQIVGKGKVTAEEINQIAERVPEVRKVMMEAFGTASTEAIQKMNISAEAFIETLVEGFSKLPRVVGGTRNEIENFNDAVLQAKVAVGQALLPAFTEALGVLTKLVNWFNKLSDTTKSIITWAGAITGGIAALTASLAGIVLLIPKVISGLAALKTAYLFLQSTQTLGLTTALGGAAIAAAGLYVGLKKISDWYERNAIKTQAAQLAEGLKPMTAAEEYEELGKTLERQRQKIENLRKAQVELAKIPPKTTLEALRPAAIEAEIARIEAGIKQLESRRAKIAPIDETAMRQYAAEVTKLADDIRKAEAKNAEIRAGLIKDEQQRELELLRVRHEANIREIDARLAELKGATAEELQLAQALNAQKLEADAEYQQGRLQIIAEYTEKENMLLESGITSKQQATSKELSELQAAVQSRLGELEWEREEQKRIAEKALEERKKELDLGVRIMLEAQKLEAKYEEEFMESVELDAQRKRKLEEETTEWFKKNYDERVEASKKAYDELSKHTTEFERTIRDVRVGWAKLTAEKLKIPQKLPELQTKVKIVAKYAETSLEIGLAALGKKFLELVQSTESYQSILSALQQPLQNFQQYIINVINEALTPLIPIAKEVGQAIGTLLGAFKPIVDLMPQVVSAFQPILSEIAPLIKSLAAALAPFIEILAKNLSLMVTMLKPSITVVSYALKGLSFVLNTLSKIVTSVANVFIKMINAVIGLVNKLPFVNIPKIGEVGGVPVEVEVQLPEVTTQAKELSTWKDNISQSVSDVLLGGIKEGLSAADIGSNIEKFLKEQLFDRAIQAILLNMPLMQAAIEKWSDLVADALSPESAGGSAITDWEMQFINSAGREIKWMTENVAEEGQKLAETLGLSFDKNIDKAAQSMDAMKAASGFPADYTKVGILPQGGRLPADIHLEDLLMRPQRELWNQMSIDNKSTPEAIVSGGRAPAISDVIETKPGVSFVQNNQFSGLVNFDNPAAMRELARKLQPYTEELQERWVSS